jgi:hypothetical protein
MPQGEVATGSCVGRQQIEDGVGYRLSAHGDKATADHDDHQRPEADLDAQEGGETSSAEYRSALVLPDRASQNGYVLVA